jgi:branched-chain amino acid transport system permease protein
MSGSTMSFERLVRNQTFVTIAGSVIVAAVMIVMSSVVTKGVANQLTELLLLVTLALAWNLVGGYGGQFSLGHSIFVGMGGYSTAVILTLFETPLLATILIAGLMSAFIGVMLAYPLLRLRGPYLAVGSLGMTLAVYGWMINWDFTKASSSYQIPKYAIVDIPTLFIMTTLLALVAFIAVLLLVRSPLGLRLVALRDDETGAASLGVRRVRTLIPVWALSGFLTGLMGSLGALQKGTITVDAAFAIQFSLDAVIICVIGGLGTLWGPLIGAVIVYYLRQFSDDYSSLALVIEAVAVILVVRFVPGGIMGIVSRIVLSIRMRLGRPPASIATQSLPVVKRRVKR